MPTTLEIQNYVAEQYKNSASTRKRALLATRIQRNVQLTKSLSDANLRIYNIGDRSTATDPVDGTKCSDPVYRKISKAQEFAWNPDYSNPYHSLCGIIADEVDKLQVKLENRKMTQQEYQHLLKIPMKGLLNEWSEQIRARLKKS